MIDTSNFQFDFHPKFCKEYDKILNKHKCPTLDEDFKRLKIILIQDIIEHNNFSPHICTRIAGLPNYVSLPAFIIKNFRCKGINKGSKSGFRLTFIYYREENAFYFCEIFHKNKKAVEDKERIIKLFK